MLHGQSYFKEGLIQFTPTPEEHWRKKDGTYRTAFGPCYSHTGQIYADCDQNMSMAATRLFATRKPELPGYHEDLYRRQIVFLSRNERFLQDLQNLYADHFDGYEGMIMEAEKHHADPHPKRQLRLQAWKELQEGGVNHRLWLRNYVLYKFKKDEVAKPAKPGRAIGDLGVSASLQGFVLTNLMKGAEYAAPYREGDRVLEFVKSPNPWVLEEVFKNLISPKELHFVYFSDDSCLSLRRHGKVHRFNIDISKCDASHHEALFLALIKTFPAHVQDDVRRLVEQCELPIMIRSTANNERVVLQPRMPRLYSGSTLTTIVNNFANKCIGKALIDVDWDRVPEDLVEETVRRAAESVGYIVTVEPCDQVEDLQFLKNSPVYDTDGVMRPLLNVGVVLRSSGQCKGDLPGRGDLGVRARAFQRAFLQGCYPRVSAPFIDRMKETAGKEAMKSVLFKDLEYKVQDDATYPHFSLTNEALFRRYRLDSQQIVEMQESAGYGYEYQIGRASCRERV